MFLAAGGLMLAPLSAWAAPSTSVSDGHFRTIDDASAGTASGQGTYPSGINKEGALVGNYYTSTNQGFGFLYEDGTFTPVNDPHAGNGVFQGTDPLSINSGGAIVGYYTDAGGVDHGFSSVTGSSRPGRS